MAEEREEAVSIKDMQKQMDELKKRTRNLKNQMAALHNRIQLAKQEKYNPRLDAYEERKCAPLELEKVDDERKRLCLEYEEFAPIINRDVLCRELREEMPPGLLQSAQLKWKKNFRERQRTRTVYWIRMERERLKDIEKIAKIHADLDRLHAEAKSRTWNILQIHQQ